MSKILKVAVTDARLMQEEPAYAVQKGALSVSVAPFSAISASSSQMTFQVLVPSLNVFIDRKIVLSTPLSFNASLFYGGARGSSYKQVFHATGNASTNAAGISSITTSGLFLSGASVAGSAYFDAWTAAYKLGQPLQIVGPGFAPGTIVTSAATGGSSVITITFQPPLSSAQVASAKFAILNPSNYDTPDSSMSAAYTAIAQGSDGGQSLGLGGVAGGQTGWCSATSGKDLAWTQFPIQSSLVNMTATLNDCTVTTNGDTLREQLMLTSSQETLKQRTTPTCADVFAWGRDDAQNNCGNFSTYSVSNNYGDIPNGAWPVSWSSVATCTAPLNPATAVAPIAGGAATGAAPSIWPFLDAGKVYSFMPAAQMSGVAGGGGVGFYIAKVATGVQLSSTPTNVLVPYLNFQPVWTTNFPGGDIYGAVAGADILTAGWANAFSISGNILTLNVDVPPMSMVGARLYDATAGNISLTAAPLASANTTATGVFGFISGLYYVAATNLGALGKAGSQYTITWSSVSINPTLVTPGNGYGSGAYGLQGGCPVQFPLPVYGTIACTEPMVISPLIWADSAEFQSVGLYGMTNMQFVLNFSTLGTTRAIANSLNVLSGTTAKSTSSQPYWVDDLTQNNPNTGNILRSSNIRSVLSDLTFASTGTNGPWGGGSSMIYTTTAGVPTMHATFLTPGVDVQLPDVSTVPYSEFPRYFYNLGTAMTTGDVSITSQTISLTSIPDMLMVYVKPNTRGPSQLDTYIPVRGASITFDNFSNLCSSYQQPQLYECAVAAGLDIDYHQWRGFTQAQYPSGVIGYATGATSGVQAYTAQSPFTQTAGGPLLLRFGQDITLQPGLAPGCLGNYSLQVTLTLDNRKGFFTYTTNPVITIIAINSGFFETMRGQSAIRKTILQMADVAAATTDSGMSKTHLNRMVGRGNFMSGASNLAHRALGAFKTAKGINDRYGLTDLARTYGGNTGSRIADMADSAMTHGANMHDSLYGASGSGKRHRSSGL